MVRHVEADVNRVGGDPEARLILRGATDWSLSLAASPLLLVELGFIFAGNGTSDKGAKGRGTPTRPTRACCGVGEPRAQESERTKSLTGTASEKRPALSV